MSGTRAESAMRMRQSLAQFEAAFREETVEDRQRREQLRREAVRRSQSRRIERTRKHGKLRYVALLVAMVATAIFTAVVMFEALLLLIG